MVVVFWNAIRGAPSLVTEGEEREVSVRINEREKVRGRKHLQKLVEIPEHRPVREEARSVHAIVPCEKRAREPRLRHLRVRPVDDGEHLLVEKGLQNQEGSVVQRDTRVEEVVDPIHAEEVVMVHEPFAERLRVERFPNGRSADRESVRQRTFELDPVDGFWGLGEHRDVVSRRGVDEEVAAVAVGACGVGEAAFDDHHGVRGVAVLEDDGALLAVLDSGGCG